MQYVPQSSRRIIINGLATKPLTPLEHRVFNALFQDADAIVSRDVIAQAGWSTTEGITNDVITQIVKRIRTKVKEVTNAPDLIQTMRGEGYRFNSQP